jgi:hypothetical protein
LKNLFPQWKKWQKVWKNRIMHFTPRVDPQHPDVEIEGVIEIWNPEKPKGEPQITSVKMSAMFGRRRWSTAAVGWIGRPARHH